MDEVHAELSGDIFAHVHVIRTVAVILVRFIEDNDVCIGIFQYADETVDVVNAVDADTVMNVILHDTQIPGFFVRLFGLGGRSRSISGRPEAMRRT